MDRTLADKPAHLRVAGMVGDPRRCRGRGMIASMCVAGVMYLAFAVGAPWLLRDAPPDTYTVVATSAACAAAHVAPADCTRKPAKRR